MGNILRCFRGDDDDQCRPISRWQPHYQPHYTAAPPASRPPEQPLDPHGVAPATASVAVLARDLLNFECSSKVPQGLGQHVTSSRKVQVQWYQNMLEAYKNTRLPPRTPAEASQLVARALSWIQRADLEGILHFYNFPIPSLPAASPKHHPSLIPDGVQFVLNTLPVNNYNIGDGDGFSVYVSTTDPSESANVPTKVLEMVIARTKARKLRDYKSADALLRKVEEAGYKIITCSDEDILARKYRIRMKGIDAPELDMEYGKEAKNALVKLIGGKSTTIHVYGQDKFDRYVGDIYCDNVFIQEQMLKNGHAWHFLAFDKRPELAEWQRKARAACQGLFASPNPVKPWDWRRDQRNRGHSKRDQRNGGPSAIQVY